jgi:hypothetical protein
MVEKSILMIFNFLEKLKCRFQHLDPHAYRYCTPTVLRIQARIQQLK